MNLLNHVDIHHRVFFPSTALTYKESELPIKEDGATDLKATYAQSKAIGEQLVKSLCEKIGVEHTIVRFFNIFGPGQHPMYIVPQVIQQIHEGEIVLRNGSVLRDMLYVDDCVDAVLRLVVASEAADSTFNIGSGEIVSIGEIAKQAVEATGQTTVSIVDQNQNITYSPSAIIADIGKVKSTIDWFPTTSLKDGLSRMWRASNAANPD